MQFWPGRAAAASFKKKRKKEKKGQISRQGRRELCGATGHFQTPSSRGRLMNIYWNVTLSASVSTSWCSAARLLRDAGEGGPRSAASAAAAALASAAVNLSAAPGRRRRRRTPKQRLRASAAKSTRMRVLLGPRQRTKNKNPDNCASMRRNAWRDSGSAAARSGGSSQVKRQLASATGSHPPA